VVVGIRLFDMARYELSQFAHDDANIGRRHFSPRLISMLLSYDPGSDKTFKSVCSARVLPCQGGATVGASVKAGEGR
jgi:hypothetical protein